MNREIVTRGVLPHWYVPGAAHFVTYRLAGTLPWNVLETLRLERQSRLEKLPKDTNPYQFKLRVHKELFLAYDNYLDQSSKLDWLARPEVASIIRENLYHHDGRKYHFLAYCIMPNENPGRAGQLWQHESYDHWVRDDNELERIVAYIIGNPVKAGLARSPQEWPFSSAYDCFLRDGSLLGFLPMLRSQSCQL